MKEANSDKPYFTLKVDNSDILEKIEEMQPNEKSGNIEIEDILKGV